MVKNKFDLIHSFLIRGDNMLKNKNGFTVVELLLVIAISGVIMMGLNLLFFSGYKSYNLGNNQAHIQRNIRLIETILNKQIKYADSIKIKNNKKPSDASNYKENIQLVSGNEGNYKLKYNGRTITEEIIKEMNIINFSNSNLKLKFTFTDNTEITFNILLNNL